MIKSSFVGKILFEPEISVFDHFEDLLIQPSGFEEISAGRKSGNINCSCFTSEHPGKKFPACQINNLIDLTFHEQTRH